MSTELPAPAEGVHDVWPRRAWTPVDRVYIEAHRIEREDAEAARAGTKNLMTLDEAARELVARSAGVRDLDLEEARAIMHEIGRSDGPYYGRDFHGRDYGATVELRVALTVTVDVGEYLLAHGTPTLRGTPSEADRTRHALQELRSQATDEARAAVAALGWVGEVRYAQPRVELIWE